MEIKPVILQGNIVRLEPLGLAHLQDLCLVGFNPEIWRFLPMTGVDNLDKMRHHIQDLLDLQSSGGILPFAVIDVLKRQAIGCTRFMDIRHKDRGLEIGGTWYGVKSQRTGINTESKYLLLKEAFETYECIRVQLKTDLLNVRSQRAIERVGAVREGVLRNHMILPQGTIRDTVYYSILDREWPQVKANLEEMMNR